MTDIFAFSYTQTLKGKETDKNLLLYDSVVNEKIIKKNKKYF
jgi:hypothetical protein